MAYRMLRGGIVASLFLAGATYGAAAQSSDGPPVDGGTAVIGIGSDLKTLNPTINTGAGETAIGCMIHDGLIAIKEDGTYTPGLAKSWTISPDGKTYTFDLVETNWHDGKPFTSKDVEFFMTKVVTYAPLIASQVGKKIAKVEPMGDRKIAVTLTEPFGPFLRMLACYNGGAIIPAHIYAGSEPAANPASNAPIGTGPFKFVDWKAGDVIRLAKNDKYWRTKVHLDSVVVRVLPNPGSRTQALKAGEVDYLNKFYVPTSDIATIKADPKLKLVGSGLPPNMMIAFFNIANKPLDNKKVRHALFSVIDRNFIRDAIFSGQGLSTKQPFPRQIEWTVLQELDYDKLYPNDVAAANKILDEAGLPRDASGIRFKLNVNYQADVPERTKTALLIQDAWKKLGVEVSISPVELAVLTPMVYKDKKFDIHLTSYSTYGDPAVGLGRIWISEAIGREFGNAAHYRNPKVDELFAKAAVPSNIEERAAIYREAQMILADELPVMSFHENKGVDAASARLKGLWGYEGHGRWEDAWLAKN